MSDERVNLDLGNRDYEVSVWTLQDSYLTTLKWSGIDHKGQIQEPKMTIQDDGTENFSFSVPMYLNVYSDTDDQMIKVENPIWYKMKTEDILLQNMRKIKVIFNKTMGSLEEKQKAGERVYEFLIVKVTDSHEEDNPKCNVECEGLAFHELGKQGFKIELSADVLYDRLKKYSEGETWYDNNHIGHKEEPKETIDYWLNDIGIGNYYKENQIDESGIYTGQINRTSRAATKWYYKIEMNYGSYSLLPTGQERDIHKIYEEAYISSWDDNLDPVAVTAAAEKCRLVDANESNLYNLTQTIAETFEVFCRYEYEYDDNYCIIGRNVVFYNNFIQDGQAFVDLTYPHTSVKIEREYDGTEITTKMFVRPEDDESTLTGQISIIDTDANPTKEDYIMNFDYLHKIGTISDEQYDSIKPFETEIREVNVGNSTIVDELNNRVPNPQTASRRVVGDRTFVYELDTILHQEYMWQPIDQKETTQAEQDEIDKYVPNPVGENTTYTLDGKTYTYTHAGWVDDTGECIEGLIDLQERLIAKEERKVEVDAKVTTAQNTIENAEERMADAQKNIENKSIQEVGITQPKKHSILTDENGSRYINLGTNNKEILFDTIRMYHQWDSTASARQGAIEQDAFPNLNMVTPPPATPIVINWDDTRAQNAIKIYRKIKKAINKDDVPSAETVQNTINQWCININDSTQEIIIPNSKSSDIANDDSASTFYQGTGILSDALGWVLYAAGYASIGYMNSKKFKRYVVKQINFNGTIYKLGDLTTDNKIGSKAWNSLIKARKAWRLSVAENLKKSDIIIDNNSVYGQPTSWLSGNVSNLYVTCSNTNAVEWTFSGYGTKSSLLKLWQDHNNNDASYYDFLANQFNVSIEPNKIVHFSPKRDSNNSLTALVNISVSETTSFVYLLYSWDPDLYWEQIKEIWDKKASAAKTEKRQYSNEQDILNEQIAALKEQIRKKLKRKHDLIESFTAMMGPALRESYWQPENYHNYGDVYTATLGLDNFVYSDDNDSMKKVHAKFVWDTELFSEEQKIYYYYGVNLAQRYYECLDIQNIYTRLKREDSAKAALLLEKMNELIFSFYNDDLDRMHKVVDENGNDVYNENGNLEYEYPRDLKQDTANGPWYYTQAYNFNDSNNINNNKGSFSRNIEVERKEYSRKFYAMNASIFPGFVHKKDNTNKVIPILLVTGLDELPDETIHFIQQSLTVTDDEHSAHIIHPGAQPELGYMDDNNVFQAICAVAPDDWFVSRFTAVDDEHPAAYETVYPRIKINSLQLKRNELILTCSKPSLDKVIEDANLLSRYNDYSILNRRNDYYITIKPEVFFRTLGETLSSTINLLTDVAFSTTNTDDSVVRDYMNELKDIPYSIITENDIEYIEISIPNKSIIQTKLINVQTAGVIDKAKIKTVIQNDSHFNLCYPFNLTYIISNGGTYIYIDAQKVLKENSAPKVAYTVQPNLMYRTTNKFAQYALGQIVMINDYELKLENVFGYISEITMDLDHPWEDEITVKDYKNKFEDLFSSITAEVEEMKKNGGLLNALSTGMLTPTIASTVTSLNNNNLSEQLPLIWDQYRDSDFDDDVIGYEMQRIFLEADEILSSGAYVLEETATINQENARMFASMLGNISERLTPNIFTINTNDPNSSGLNGYKIGDICIAADGSRYMAVDNYTSGTDSAFKPVYDGTVSLIKGASMEIDAEKGVVSMLAEHQINIKSGNNVNISADAEINIVGNESVNIGGTTINICSATILGTDGNDTAVSTTVEGGVNIISSAYDESYPDRNNLSGVFIKPSNIEMISSEIKMVTGLQTSEQNVSQVGSGILISGDKGIWIGTNCDAGIRLYAGPAGAVYNEAILDDPTIISQDNIYGTGTSLELLPEQIFFGTLALNNEQSVYGTSLYMDPTQFILASGSASNYKDKTISGASGLIGARFTSNSIGFATAFSAVDTNGNPATGINAILMNSSGLTIGSGVGFDATNPTGSFVQIAPGGILVGTNGYLKVCANNQNFIINSSGDSNGVYFKINTVANNSIVYGNTGLTVTGAITTSSLTVNTLSSGYAMQIYATGNTQQALGFHMNNSTMNINGTIGGISYEATNTEHLFGYMSMATSATDDGKSRDKINNDVGNNVVITGTITPTIKFYTSTNTLTCTGNGSTVSGSVQGVIELMPFGVRCSPMLEAKDLYATRLHTDKNIYFENSDCVLSVRYNSDEGKYKLYFSRGYNSSGAREWKAIDV